MLTTKKLCRLFFKAAVKSFRPFFLLGLAVTIALPLLCLLRYGTGKNIMLGIGAAQVTLAIILLLGGFFNLLGILQQTWQANRYRLLPVTSKQVYFGSLSMQTLAFGLVVGILLLINLISAFLIFKNWSQIVWKFSGSSSLGFSLNTGSSGNFVLHLGSRFQILWQFILLLAGLWFSIVDLSFLLLLARTLANLLIAKYQKLSTMLAFIILSVLFTMVTFKLTSFFATDWLLFGFDLAITVLCMLGSIYLLKNWIETTK